MTKPIAYRQWLCMFMVIASLASHACSTTNVRETERPVLEAGLVVLGTVAKSGLNKPFNPQQSSDELVELLAARSDLSITPTGSVRSLIGDAPHDEMLAFYARNGVLAPYQVQRLMAANLPFSKALYSRIEHDGIERLPVLRRPVLNESGQQIADREIRVHTVRRTTRASASLLDLRTGRVIWTRQYQVSPESLNTSEHRLGESLGASIAAAMANTLLQGASVDPYPLAPSLASSVRALLREIALHVPLQE